MSTNESLTSIGIVVVTHGGIATELVAAARRIVGALESVRAVSIDWNDDPRIARERIGTALKEVDAGVGVLVLTDMFGGTPTNLALTFLEKDRVEVVTGVNLPMLIKSVTLKPGESFLQLAERIRSQGQKNIYVASEMLERPQEG